MLLTQVCEGPPSGRLETLHCLLKDLGEAADVALSECQAFPESFARDCGPGSEVRAA